MCIIGLFNNTVILKIVDRLTLLSLNAIQIPKKPPTAVKIAEENVKKPAPHKLGTYPPMAEPTNIPIQISVLELIS